MTKLQKNTLTAFFAIAFLAMLTNITVNAAQFVAACLLLSTIGLTAYVGFRVFKLVLDKLSTLFVKKAPQPTVNTRIANATKAKATRRKGMSGQDLMDIPAYARKEKGICYPMNLQVLNGARYTVQAQQ